MPIDLVSLSARTTRANVTAERIRKALDASTAADADTRDAYIASELIAFAIGELVIRAHDDSKK